MNTRSIIPSDETKIVLMTRAMIRERLDSTPVPYGYVSAAHCEYVRFWGRKISAGEVVLSIVTFQSN